MLRKTNTNNVSAAFLAVTLAGAAPAWAQTTSAQDESVAAAQANLQKAQDNYIATQQQLIKDRISGRKTLVTYMKGLCGRRDAYLEAYANMGDDSRALLKEVCAHPAPKSRKR